MNHSYLLTNGILWAIAILASAIVNAPDFLTLVLLPALGAMAFLLAPRNGQDRGGTSPRKASGC